MGKELRLEITFKDGNSVNLRPTGGEAEKAIRNFKEGKSIIAIQTLEGGVEGAVFSASEIRSIVPRWIEV